MVDQREPLSRATADARPPRELLVLMTVLGATVTVEVLFLPELFGSPIYGALRAYLAVFGAVSFIATAGAAVAASGRVPRLGTGLGLLCASIPAFGLALALWSTRTPTGAWSWTILTLASVGLGAALLAGRAPRWHPVPIVVGLVLAGNGALMLAVPGSFSPVVYGEIAGALLPFGLLLLVAGAGVVAGEVWGRRRLALAATGLSLIGLGGLVVSFIPSGIWTGVGLYWTLALFLAASLVGKPSRRRIAHAQLALTLALSSWMLVTHLAGRPSTGLSALAFHASLVAITASWLLAELRPAATFPTRLLGALAVAFAGANLLQLQQFASASVSLHSAPGFALESGTVVLLLAIVLLARTVWPARPGVIVGWIVSSAAALGLGATLLLVTSIGGVAFALFPDPDLEVDQAFLLLAIGSSLGLLGEQRAAAGSLPPRIYAVVGAMLAVVVGAAAVTARGIETLGLPGQGDDPAVAGVTIRVLMMLGSVAVLSALGFAVVVNRGIARPLSRMREVIGHRVAGDRTARVLLDQADEFGALGAALDESFAAVDATLDQLAVERALLRAVVEGSVDAFVAADSTGRIVEWSARAEALLGWPAAEALGRQLSELIVPPKLREAHLAGFARAFRDPGVPMFGRRMREAVLHRDGHSISAEISINALVPGIDRVGAFIRDVSETERYEASLSHLALYDPLTDLPNRTLVGDRWKLAGAVAKRDGRGTALAILDLDQFKAVNDSLGHVVGDEVLVEVGRRLSTAVRGTDAVARISDDQGDEFVVGRLGGDEFVLLLSGVRPNVDARALVEAKLAGLKAPFELAGRSIILAASAGVYFSERAEEPFSDALRKADLAMYEAKRAGGDRVVAYTPSVEVDTKGWIGLGADLKSAIEAGGLRLAYQPMIDAGSGEALEVEALARWDHPERGPIPPQQFVAVAERSGLINALGSWILQRALDDVEHWRAAGIELGVHVNVSVRQLAMDGFAQTVVEEVERRGLRRGVITIELTESLLARDLPRVREDLVRLRGSGIRVSLDDFGTGYSSIGYLESLPLDEIKVDKAMTLGIVDDRRRLSILRGSRALARGLGLAFVVEGVEDERTWDLLETLGDCRMQGYGVGRPMPADALAGWLATHRERVQARRAAQQAVAVGRSLSAQRQIEVSARSAPSLDSLMGNLWHELRDVVPYDRIGVALLEDDGRILRARWARATYSEALRISHGYSAPMAASSLAEILRTGKPRIIGDLVQHLARNPDSMSTRLIVGEGVRSSLTCPLIVGDTAVGFLFFSSREPDAYHDAHVSSFQSLAELVSGSVAQVSAMPRLFADA